MAESVFARQPKPRMRQQRNNSVASALDGPAGGIDEAQLSIVPDADEPTFDDVVDTAGPAAALEQDPAPQGDPAPDVEPADHPDEPADSALSDGAAEAPTTKDAGTTKSRAKTTDAEDSAVAPANGPEAAGPTPDDTRAPDADDEPAQQAPEPDTDSAPAPASAKKTGKTAAAKARTSHRTAEPAPPAGSGAALAVINPDGSVTVDAGIHLIDLREVAAQDDPHALVDMLGALRAVTDGDLRQHVTAEISAAITAAALRA